MKKEVKISDFDFNKLNDEQLKLAKKVSSYIVYDLMDKYVVDMIASRKWPQQCIKIEEYIIEKDLASIINLEGTRNKFIDLYQHAVKTIGHLIDEEKDVIISNSDSNCLTFSNFLKITEPFPLIKKYHWDGYKTSHKKIQIIINNNECDLLEINNLKDFEKPKTLIKK
ncbi:MAG: hypothetical protein PHO63_05260 [Bacilli bacterium]|nr:hypothetical protein [Bacilli bacterium]MDD4808546.1 hypothetical protein [Bacilli bacterium]